MDRSNQRSSAVGARMLRCFYASALAIAAILYPKVAQPFVGSCNTETAHQSAYVVEGGKLDFPSNGGTKVVSLMVYEGHCEAPYQYPWLIENVRANVILPDPPDDWVEILPSGGIAAFPSFGPLNQTMTIPIAIHAEPNNSGRVRRENYAVKIWRCVDPVVGCGHIDYVTTSNFFVEQKPNPKVTPSPSPSPTPVPTPSPTPTATAPGPTVTMSPSPSPSPTPVPCALDVTPSRFTIPAEGGLGEVAVLWTCDDGLNPWSYSKSPILKVVNRPGKKGHGTLVFSLGPTTTARTATITVSARVRIPGSLVPSTKFERTVTIDQPAPPPLPYCDSASLTVTPDALAFPQRSETLCATVSVAAPCTWQIMSVPSWLTATETVGNTSTTVCFAAPSNGDQARSGDLSINLRRLHVSQSGRYAWIPAVIESLYGN